MRGDEDSERLEKNPHREQLTMRKLTSSDEGTYKVLDEHGLAVSTVQLSVEGESPTGSPGDQHRFGLNKDSNVLVAHGSEFCKCQTTVFKLNWKLRELVERLLSFQILLLCSDPSVPSTLLHLHSCSYIYLPFLPDPRLFGPPASLWTSLLSARTLKKKRKSRNVTGSHFGFRLRFWFY